MKKLLLLLILFGLVGGAGFVGYTYIYPTFFPSNQNITSEETDLESNPTEETTEDEEEIIIEEESTQEPEVIDEGIITDSISQEASPTPAKRKVPALSEKKLFENTFVRFAYPSSLEIQTKTMNSLEVFKDTNRQGTIAIYNNDENQPLEEFLKKDNLVDYFTESAKFNIKPLEFEIPTAKRAFIFKNFPGFVTSDIIVIEFDKLILVVSDWSENDLIQEYIATSIEKLN